jgi:sec-independent protein translocase protein TatB
MPSFSDSIFLFALALLLFGPKKLPVLARELGKWIGEFRRASNEFKMQMEEELRQVEQADRQKQIAAMEAAAPIAPSLDPPESPYVAPASPEDPTQAEPASSDSAQFESAQSQWEPTEVEGGHPEPQAKDPGISPESANISTQLLPPDPLPIAISGDLRIMPPSTGLPAPRSNTNPLGGLLDSIPKTSETSPAAPDTSELAVASKGEAHVR